MSLKDFQVLNRLGEGSFSSVWKVKRLSDGKEYAMKKVKMNALSEKEKQNALNEVRILASISSPYIIGYKEAFFDDSSMTLCIIMEFAAGGDILGKITQHQKNRTAFKEKEIWAAFLQMLKGLKVLHDNKILHRDLKCANVFLTSDGTAKLGDLNVSKIAKNDLAHTQTGTPYYASPEVWQDKPYDSKSDIWSLGCVVYEMAALKPPFRANDLQGLFKKVQKGIFDKIPSIYSKDLNDVIALCLQTNPKVRPSSDQLLVNPIVVKNSGSMDFEVEDESQMDLLGTIKMPRNPKALANQLPKANYQSVDLNDILPNRGRQRGSSANARSSNPLSRESGSVDNLREMNSKAQEKLYTEENSEKARVIRANPGLGLPPRKELDPQKRQISHRVLEGGNVPTPRNDQNSYGDDSNRGRISRDNSRNLPPLSQNNPIYNNRQDELISKYQKIDPRLQQGPNRYESPNSYRRLSGEYVPDKKADYLLQKYNPDQYLQKPPTPSSKPTVTKDQELFMKYNNLYKQSNDLNKAPEYITPYARQNSPGRNQGIYIQNIRNNSPSQRSVDVRPIWWG